MSSVEPVIAPPVEPARLLYVDDLQPNLFAMAQLLGAQSYSLDLARSADEALRLLMRHNYACILCDVQMPDMDGYELIKLVRTDPEHSHTPVLFITAHGSSDTRVRAAFELGAFDYITKPIDAAVLRAKLSVFADLRRRTEELAAEKELFHGAMSSLGSGVLIFDTGTASYMNPAMSRLWGLEMTLSSAGATFGRLELFDPETKLRLGEGEHPFRQATRGEAAPESLVFFQNAAYPQGCCWAVSVTRVAPSDRADGWRTVCVVRDVTEEQRRNQALRGKNRDLQQFAYAASHDLKAPIRHISAFAGILSDALASQEQAPEVAEALGVITRAADEMRALVDGLLAISTSGAKALEPEFVELASLLRSAWGAASADLPGGAELSCAVDLPTLWADVEALRIVVSNLLGNAIKFREKTRPLQVRVTATEQPLSHRIVIRDNGIGIDAEHRDRVFTVFQRLHPKQAFEGSGIGLALCRQLVELHGASIHLEGNDGPGLAVVLEWPRKLGKGPAPLRSMGDDEA